jgi:hypothetical protein
MGIYFTDQYSLLHFATGIVVYFWGLSFINWNILHFIFEYTENTVMGMKLINKITIWPGGKEKADSFINNVGDQFYASLGWLFTDIVLRYTNIKS